jgi:hypothetical protein
VAKMINDKIIATLLTILLALGGWTLSRTFSLSQDMVLIKEKVSQLEEKIDSKFKKKKKKKKKAN